jgi:hypothetical protein
MPGAVGQGAEANSEIHQNERELADLGQPCGEQQRRFGAGAEHASR